MIKVTLGEELKEKPFPKLMISELGQIIYAVKVNEERDDLIVGFLFHSNGYGIGGHGFSEKWARSSFIDYNNAITIQNA